MLAALLALSLAASTPAAEASAPPKPKVVKLAAPGLEAVDIDPKKAQFLNDYLSEQVGRRTEGRIQMLTQTEVTALIGLERTKALLGCSEQSSECLAEISGALGVDGLIVGNVAKFGDSFAMTIKVLSSGDGKPMFSASNTGMKEAQLLDWVKTVSMDLVAKLDPMKGVVTTPTGPSATVAVPKEDNRSLYLTLLGAEFDWRIKGPSWVGGRVAINSGFVLERGGVFSLNAQLMAVARYMPLPANYKWMWSAFAGIGLGGFGSAEARPDGSDFPISATIGIEGGFQSLRLSVELMYADRRFAIIPGLAIAITF